MFLCQRAFLSINLDILVTLPFSIYENAISRLPANYKTNPKTIGEHLIKYCSDRNLTMHHTAKQIGVSPASILLLETGKCQTDAENMRKAIEFIVYDPYAIKMD